MTSFSVKEQRISRKRKKLKEFFLKYMIEVILASEF
jgi:hypothetical protein